MTAKMLLFAAQPLRYHTTGVSYGYEIFIQRAVGVKLADLCFFWEVLVEVDTVGRLDSMGERYRIRTVGQGPPLYIIFQAIL